MGRERNEGENTERGERDNTVFIEECQTLK